MAAARFLAIALFAAACATTEAPGTYEAVLPADGGGERHVRVTLRADGTAALTNTFSESASRSLAEGAWEGDGSQITLKLAGEQIVLRRSGDQLIGKEWVLVRIR